MKHVWSRLSSSCCVELEFIFFLRSSNHPLITRSISVAVFFIFFSNPPRSNHLNHGMASDGTNPPITSPNCLIAF
ncbi:hypothetical protein HanRHA438_Chr05g0232391 [Helianthus annuus]|nr:hypothetical protein HanRHA438_Chr05g0232391 [Helianthus annuus]